MFQIDKNLWRGARPINFADLVPFGIKTDINLEVGWYELFHSKFFDHNPCQDESDTTALLGIKYIHDPIDDFFFPSKEKLDQIQTDIQNGLKIGPVFFHCIHGRSRSGIVCAIYRVRYCGYTVDAAIKEMMGLQFEVFPYKYLGWIDNLREYLK